MKGDCGEVRHLQQFQRSPQSSIGSFRRLEIPERLERTKTSREAHVLRSITPPKHPSTW
jgi:hypothetical protein